MSKVVSLVHNDLHKIQNKSAKELIYLYFTELLAASILLRHGDSVAENILSDRNGRSIKKYSKTMSQLNALGHVINEPNSIHARELLSKSTIRQLETASGRILEKTFIDLHRELSSPKDGCDFFTISECLRILSLRFELRNKKLNHIRFVIENWLMISGTEKSIAMSELFTYMYKYNRDSVLFPRLRIVSNEILLTANKKADNVVKFDRLNEEDASVISVGSGDIASKEKKLFKGKLIRRVKRNYTPDNPFTKRG